MRKFLFTIFLCVLFVGCSDESERDLMDGNTANVDDSTNDITIETEFNNEIKPIIAQNCTPCHVSGGSNTNYTSFANAQSRINTIIDRINRDTSDSGSMPQGGEKLSDTDLAKFDAWLETINAE